MNNNELMHFGVKGMKWGVRRKLTPEEKRERMQKVRSVASKIGKKTVSITKDHTGLNTHDMSRKEFRYRRKTVAKSRSAGVKLATNLLSGPFANRTYNSVIAAGGSKAGAIGMTAVAGMLGGPTGIGHVVVSSLYTNHVSEKTYRK